MKKKLLFLMCSLLFASVFALAACSNDTCKVTLDANGGTIEQSVIIAEKGQRLNAIPSAKRGSWFFGGWYSQKDGGKPWNFDKDVVQGDMTLYARWLNQGVTVTYDLNLPTAVTDHSEEIQTVLIARNTCAIKPFIPTVKGFVFLGMKDDEGNDWDFSTPILQDITLHAQWRVSCELTLVNEGRVVSSWTAVKGQNCYGLPGLIRDGYVFGGWTTDQNGENPFVYGMTVYDNMTLYAKWYEQTDTKYFFIEKEKLLFRYETVNNEFDGDTLVLPSIIDNYSYTSIDVDNYPVGVIPMPKIKKIIMPACVQELALGLIDMAFPNLETLIIDGNSTIYCNYEGALYDRRHIINRNVSLIWAPKVNGYVELNPRTNSVSYEGTFFMRGYNEIQYISLSKSKVLIVEDKYYSDYYKYYENLFGQGSDKLNYLIKLSDYEQNQNSREAV